jgi:IS5 family transposase
MLTTCPGNWWCGDLHPTRFTALSAAPVWGDQAYRGQSEVLRQHAPHTQDFTHQRYRYKDRIDEVERAKNRTKSKVRSKVEHVFAVLKLKFGFVKVRYRGLDKNATFPVSERTLGGHPCHRAHFF